MVRKRSRLQARSARHKGDDGRGWPRRPVYAREWVWSLYGEARVLDAVDLQLGWAASLRRATCGGCYLVGLACASPEPALRFGMRAVQMLSGKADLLLVPAAWPSMSLSPNHQLLLSLHGLAELVVDDQNAAEGRQDIGFSSTSSYG